MRVRAKAIAATAVLAAAIGTAAAALAQGQDGHGQQVSTAASQTPPSPAASPASSLATADDAAPRGEATAFVAAWGTPRWDDLAPGAWADRAAGHATDAFAAQLRSVYRGGSGGTAWTDLVGSRGLIQNVVDRLDPAPAATGHRAYIVLYRTLTVATGSGHATAGTALVDLVPEHGQWRVAAFGPVASGGIAQSPATTPAAPPTVSDAN